MSLNLPDMPDYDDSSYLCFWQVVMCASEVMQVMRAGVWHCTQELGFLCSQVVLNDTSLVNTHMTRGSICRGITLLICQTFE